MSDLTRAPGFAEAVARQRVASDPDFHVSVMANAGSGKTRVLVDRVIRLLLRKADPSAILCITYTKAAAAEMQGRLFETLGKWATLQDDELRAELAKLEPDQPDGGPDLQEARALFARALETPGGLKIQTIHGFCERLLRRFPLEAGVVPGFRVLDDADNARYLDDARNRLVAQQDPTLQRAIQEAQEILGDSRFEKAVAAIAGDRARWRADLAVHGGPDGLEAQYVAHFQISDPQHTLASMKEEAGLALDQALLEELAQAYEDHGGNTDKVTHLPALQRVLDATDALARFEAFDRLMRTDDGPVRKSIASTKVAESSPRLLEAFGGAAKRHQPGYVYQDWQDITAAMAQQEAFYLHRSLARIASFLVATLDDMLPRAGRLAFDDLIDKATHLLEHSEAADWVRYKLDGGIEHILVDEAQDTSPQQWRIVEAFSREMVSGDGVDRETGRMRTVFSVGDPKQSIFSFQGAEPAAFAAFETSLKAAAEAAARYQSPQLQTSFRSSQHILRFVDTMFDRAPNAPSLGLTEPFASEVLRHRHLRGEGAGFVDVLRPVHTSGMGPGMANLEIANRIADEIEALVGMQMPDDPGEERPISYGDILILLQKRQSLYETITKVLARRGIPLAGRDRLKLTDDLAVSDCLALARACLNPLDDLSVAEVLMGPLCHPAGVQAPPLDLERLAEIRNRCDRSLFAQVMRDDHDATAPARHLFDMMRRRAMVEAPFEFFSGLLKTPSETGETYLKRLTTRLGAPSVEVLEVFLERALASEDNGPASLERFIHEVQTDQNDVKRRLEHVGDVVRLMTAHGAKGLEAPIVILPCMSFSAPSGLEVMRHGDARLPLWRNNHKLTPGLMDAANEAEARAHAEYCRLLYVAVTRARDGLIVLGTTNKTREDKKGKEGWLPRDWFDFLEATAQRYEGGVELDDRWRCGERPCTMAHAQPVHAKTRAEELASWLEAPVPLATNAPRVQAASALYASDAESEARFLPGQSPLSVSPLDGRARGTLIHKLLEQLPALPQAKRLDHAGRFLAAAVADEALRQSMAEEVRRVLTDPQLDELFGPNGRAEVPVWGVVDWLGDGVEVVGRIDRLVERSGDTLILDYKSDRPPPQHPSDVAPAYLRQLAAYQDILSQNGNEKPVRCALLWTWTGQFMAIDDDILQAARGR